MEPKPDKQKPAFNVYKYAGLGTQMLVFIGLSVWAGMWLDTKMGTAQPWFLISFALLGCVGSMVYLIVQFNDMNKKN